MITWYMKEKKTGQYCKCKFKDWHSVNYALLTLCWAASEDGSKFKIITEEQFNRKAKGRALLTQLLVPKDGTDICGSFAIIN